MGTINIILYTFYLQLLIRSRICTLALIKAGCDMILYPFHIQMISESIQYTNNTQKVHKTQWCGLNVVALIKAGCDMSYKSISQPVDERHSTVQKFILEAADGTWTDGRAVNQTRQNGCDTLTKHKVSQPNWLIGQRLGRDFSEVVKDNQAHQSGCDIYQT